MELTKEKREHFLYQIFCQKEILFSICVLSPCVVYWLHLQNIHSFAYQKTLIHTSFCLKSLKAFSVFLRVVLVGTKNMHQKIFRRIWWFSNFSWLKGSLNISPMYLCVFQMNFHVSYFFQGFFPILTTSWKKGILLFGKVISCFFLLINTYCTQHHIFFKIIMHLWKGFMNILPDKNFFFRKSKLAGWFLTNIDLDKAEFSRLIFSISSKLLEENEIEISFLIIILINPFPVGK